MQLRLRILAALVLCLATFGVPSITVQAQGTAFTYQGRLASDANAANGVYDLTFSVWNNATGPAQIGATLTNSSVAVSNGLFNATLDFGNGVFTGANRWLEIAVRTNDTGAFTPLSPRQRLTATPYAVTAGNITGVVPNAGVAGTYANAVTLNNAANQLTGSFSGNGSGLSNVNALTIGGLTSAAFWRLEGNNVAPGQFLGSTNNQPLELRVNGQRALRLEPDPNGAPNVIAGSPANLVDSGVIGATISGGGAMNLGGVAYPNQISGYFGSVGGGIGNLVQGFGSAIGGGLGNTITFIPYYSTIAGGSLNAIDNNANNSFIGSGVVNTNSAPFSVIVGGRNNIIEVAADLSSIGGGWLNYIQSGADQSVIAGGNAGQILSGARESFIGGGFANKIQTNAGASFLGGGLGNSIQMDSGVSFIGGGAGNMIGSNSAWGTIPGGQDNVIQPDTSWATIGGGTGNSNSGRYATIGGGLRNNAAGFQSAIGGGVVNSIGTNSTYSTIGGGQGNAVSANTSGILIGGGARNTVGSITLYGTIAGGWSNSIIFNLNQPTIAGGFANSIRTGGDYSFIGGGARNTNSGFVSLIVGGQDNTIEPLADHSVIAGGGNNRITGSLPLPVYATISGGQGNSVQTNATFPVIGGGVNNTVRADAQYATIPGGASNSVAGRYSFAAGNRAEALHDGAFVWADANGTNFSSTASNQFLIRASGGVGIGRTNPVSALDVNGVVTASGFSGSGSALSSVNAATLGGLDNSGFWKTTGNPGTTDANFIGTTDPQPLVFKVDNLRMLRIEPLGFPGTPNIIGGIGSFVTPGLQGNFIGNSSGDAGSNYITAVNFNVIGGGYANRITNGFDNFIGSGQYNTVATTERAGVIGGGSDNYVSGSYATIPGGINNAATGDRSFAAGNRAKAEHQGSFVWADSQDADFASTANDQFLIRAAGGTTFSSGSVGLNQTVSWSPGDASWSFTSDRNTKERLTPVDTQSVLEKVSRLPITEWNYIGYKPRHIGPMAQDFHEQFPLNENNKALNDADLHGVTLAAIQGLNQKLDQRLQEKDAEIAALKQTVNELRQLVQAAIKK